MPFQCSSVGGYFRIHPGEIIWLENTRQYGVRGADRSSPTTCPHTRILSKFPSFDFYLFHWVNYFSPFFEHFCCVFIIQETFVLYISSLYHILNSCNIFSYHMKIGIMGVFPLHHFIPPYNLFFPSSFMSILCCLISIFQMRIFLRISGTPSLLAQM